MKNKILSLSQFQTRISDVIFSAGRELLAYLGDRPGFVLRDVLMLCCSDGVVARLSMSDRAYNKMRELESEMDSSNDN